MAIARSIWIWIMGIARSVREYQAASSSFEERRTAASDEPKKSERDWSFLPQGPLCLISEQLQSEIDVVRFRSVCTSWRSAAPRRQSPWVLAREFGENFWNALFTLSGARIPDLPGFRLVRLYCCSFGWVADSCINGDIEQPITPGKPITLFNPITMDHINLPSIDGFNLQDLCNMRLILSNDPATTSNYTAANFCDGKLAIYRSGDEAWSVTPFPGSPDSCWLWDIAFYKGLIYIAALNRIFVFDPAAEVKSVRAIPVTCVDGKLSSECGKGREDGCGCWNLNSYLVESCGDLLLVRKDTTYLSMTIEVLKLQFCRRSSPGLVKMENLGDRALFLGRGCSFSLSATKFPEYKRNYIYFGKGVDHKMRVKMKMFSFADGKYEYTTSVLEEGWSHALWFRPHLL